MTPDSLQALLDKVHRYCYRIVFSAIPTPETPAEFIEVEDENGVGVRLEWEQLPDQYPAIIIPVPPVALVNIAPQLLELWKAAKAVKGSIDVNIPYGTPKAYKMRREIGRFDRALSALEAVK